MTDSTPVTRRQFCQTLTATGLAVSGDLPGREPPGESSFSS